MVADLVTGGTALTIIAVTLLAGVAFALIRAQRTLAQHGPRRSSPSATPSATARRRADLVAAVERAAGVDARAAGDDRAPHRPLRARRSATSRSSTSCSATARCAARSPPPSIRAVADDLRRLREEHPLELASNHPVATALRTREPVLLQDLPDEVHDYADSPEHVAHVVGVGYQSVLVAAR